MHSRERCPRVLKCRARCHRRPRGRGGLLRVEKDPRFRALVSGKIPCDFRNVLYSIKFLREPVVETQKHGRQKITRIPDARRGPGLSCLITADSGSGSLAFENAPLSVTCPRFRRRPRRSTGMRIRLWRQPKRNFPGHQCAKAGTSVRLNEVPAFARTAN